VQLGQALADRIRSGGRTRSGAGAKHIIAITTASCLDDGTAGRGAALARNRPPGSVR
jgi:hypothetical protein